MLEIDPHAADPDNGLWRGSIMTGFPLYREEARS